MTRIIAFEGLDLSGKSTCINLLSNKLNYIGYKTKINKGSLITKDVLKGEIEGSMTPFEKDLYYTYLLTNDRTLHFVTDDDIILQDRYYPSVMFYGLLNLGHKSLINKLSLNSFVQPEIFFYFKCSFEEAYKRFHQRTEKSSDDHLLLKSENEYQIRENLFDRVMEIVQSEFNNVIKIDTTNKSENDAVNEVMNYARLWTIKTLIRI